MKATKYAAPTCKPNPHEAVSMGILGACRARYRLEALTYAELNANENMPAMNLVVSK